MAVEIEEPPAGETPVVEAGVIEDARRRQRGQWRTAAGGLIVACVTAAGLIAIAGGYDGPPTAGAATSPRPLTGSPLGVTHLRLIVADTPPASVDVDSGRIKPVTGVVPGPYTRIGAPQVITVSPTRDGAYAVVLRSCGRCANDAEAFFIATDATAQYLARGESMALDPASSRLWVLSRLPAGGCTLRLVPGGGAGVRAPCGAINGVVTAGVVINDDVVVDPRSGVQSRPRESFQFLLQGDLALQSNTDQQFNGGRGKLALVNLVTGVRRRIAYPSMPRIPASDYFALQKVAVEPHGPLDALTFANPFYRPSQAAYIWILDTRTGKLTLLPGFPTLEGVKASDAEWTSDGRLVVVSWDEASVERPTSAVLGIWKPGQTTIAVRSVPINRLIEGGGCNSFAPLG